MIEPVCVYVYVNWMIIGSGNYFKLLLHEIIAKTNVEV